MRIVAEVVQESAALMCSKGAQGVEQAVEGVGVVEKVVAEAIESSIGKTTHLLACPAQIAKTPLRAINSLRRQIVKHQKKLQDYIKNSDKFDNKGFLKHATPARRNKIIETRIKSLEKQIKNFEKQINELTKIGK